MADPKMVKAEGTETREISDQEKLARLIYEMKRNSWVWNLFAGSILDGWYPGRNGTMGAKFKGTDRERIEQLFKIRDHETRHLLDVLRELGIKEVDVNYGAIYDDLSAATEITSMSHKPL